MLLDLGKMFMMTAEKQSATAIVVEGQCVGADFEGGRNGFQARLSSLGGLLATGQPSFGSGGTGRPLRLWA